MNKLLTILGGVMLFLHTTGVFAQQLDPGQTTNAPAATEYTIADRGPNHRLWQKVTTVTNALGQIRTRTNSYTELASGMHYWQTDHWAESDPTLAITPTGAAAVKGPHQVALAGNANSAVAVDLTLPDGQHLQSHLLGLCYYDTATGQNTLIASLKNSIGQLFPPNQALYADAFTDFQADIRYTYTRSGFEQDIILREQLDSPTNYNLSPETTRLEVWTEFTNPPVPLIQTNQMKNGAPNQTLFFGSMRMGFGNAFSLGETNTPNGHAPSAGDIPVQKTWRTIDGRTFLIESIPYPAIKPRLDLLPKLEAHASRAKTDHSKIAGAKTFPPKLNFQNHPEKMSLASLAPPATGYLIDYSITLDGSHALTNYVFQGDTTYFITGFLDLFGITTLEGGTVLKLDPDNSTSLWSEDGLIDCRTDQYRPAIFTVKNDDSVGETISGSTGDPSTPFGVGFEIQTGAPIFNNVRFSHGYWPMNLRYSMTAAEFKNVQWVQCAVPIETDGVSFNIRNGLITGPEVGFIGTDYTASMENVTIDQVNSSMTAVWGGPDGSETHLTNCLAVTLNNLGDDTILTDHSVVDTNTVTGVFQTVGAAAYYLANDTYRYVGTPYINASLATDLRNRTTHPPILIPNGGYTGPTNLSPQAIREGFGPYDLGYAYPSLDYAFGGVGLTNITLTIAPGTAIATYASNFNTYAIGEFGGSTITGIGTPSNPVRIVEYNTVQEQSNTNWHKPILSLVSATLGGTAPTFNFRFTDWSCVANDLIHYEGDTTGDTVLFRDTQFHGGELTGTSPKTTFHNCLFERVDLQMENTYIGLLNCLLYGGILDLTNNASFAICQNNVFDQTILIHTNISSTSYNAYYITNGLRLHPTNTHDVILTNSPSYQTGILGRFYYPTNSPLINAGSQYATNLGFYHYTTTTNQVVEANSIVDIGFHYIGTDGYGNPIDTDSDTLPDYLEDADGNGMTTGTEPNWLAASLPVSTQLGHWRFNTNTWPRDGGEAPFAISGASLVSSWNSNAVAINGSGSLNYREVEFSGHTNIQYDNGTIRFWYQPNWSSIDIGGTGPTDGVGFLIAGQWTPYASIGEWAFALNPEGNLLRFDSQTNGLETLYFEAPYIFTSNHWYQIALTYSPSNIAVYVNGLLLSTAYKMPFENADPTNHTFAVRNGLFCYPSALARNNYFQVGLQLRGQMDELETFNCPLTTAQIVAGFPAFPNSPADARLDTDYDGRGDLLEQYVDGTTTNNAISVLPTRQACFRFNDGNFSGEQGQLPLSMVGVTTNSSWSGTCLDSGAATTNKLIYRDVETNGWANFNCHNGAARFWFRPKWPSTGPGYSAPFLYMGDGTKMGDNNSHFWELSINSVGINFSCDNNIDLLNALHLSFKTNFSTNKWCQIVLNYTPTNSALYLNGLFVTNGSGATNFPDATYRANGLVIGNRLSGSAALPAQIDELETFNYPLSLAEITNNFAPIHTVDTDLSGTADVLEEMTLATNSPFLSQPVVITGVIEAEHFDQGGKGIAYTNIASNPASDYRPTGMFITNCNDLGLGYCLDKTRAGEWVKYTLDVRVGQPYAVDARVAGLGSNGVFQIEFSTNGSSYYADTGPMTITTTNWTNIIVKNVALVAGTNYLRLSFLTNGLTNGASIGSVGRFNYTSIYPSWNEGVTNILNAYVLTTNDLISNTDTWHAATNNSAQIQNAIDLMAGTPATQGARVILPAGTYYVAPLSIDESQDAEFNTCTFITRDNLEIAGAGKTNTTLIGFNRAITIFSLGITPSHIPVRRKNFTLRNLSLEDRSHLVSVTNITGGGYTNYYEKGALETFDLIASHFNDTGDLVSLAGLDGTNFANNLLITDCLFRNADHSIVLKQFVTNCAVRGCDFITWEGTNAYTGETNAIASPHTRRYPFNHAAIFLRYDNPSHNILVMGNTYNGNPNLTTMTTNFPAGTDWLTLASDGMVFFALGGNWFIGGNNITNYGLEGVQVDGGPSGIVGNVLHTYVNLYPTCAFSASSYSDGPTAADADNYYSIVGNSVMGGRHGELGIGTMFHPLHLNLSGNSFNLYPAYDRYGDDYPGAIATVSDCQITWVCGNTLQAGGHGVLIGGTTTNLVILKNDFSGATHRGIGYHFSMTDEPSFSTLQSAVVAKNILNRGDSYHLKFPYPESRNWFLLQNHYRDNGTNDVPMFLDAASSPVHFIP